MIYNAKLGANLFCAPIHSFLSLPKKYSFLFKAAFTSTTPALRSSDIINISVKSSPTCFSFSNQIATILESNFSNKGAFR